MSKFITFEGIEGSGKTTQTKLLQQYFLNKNIGAILTREPGGTKVAEEIRSILIGGDVDKMDGVCETLLNFAARRNHVEKLIKPALDSGKIVICDRFFDSTVAYQGFAEGVDLKTIQTIQKVSIGDIKPDITFLIDTDVDLAFERIKARLDNNRYERMDKEFHKKIREGFLKIAKDNPKRIIVIKGDQEQVKIHEEIIEILKNKVA